MEKWLRQLSVRSTIPTILLIPTLKLLVVGRQVGR